MIGLDHEDGSLTWLTVEADCHLGAHLGLSTNMWPVHETWGFHSIVAYFWGRESVPRSSIPGRSYKACDDYLRKFQDVTFALFYWSSHYSQPTSKGGKLDSISWWCVTRPLCKTACWMGDMVVTIFGKWIKLYRTLPKNVSSLPWCFLCPFPALFLKCLRIHSK